MNMRRATARDFEQIVHGHESSLKRLCESYENNQAKAQELYQEILVAIWKSLSGFRGDCSSRTWLFRVAHNVAISHVTKQRRNRELLEYTLEEMDQLVQNGNLLNHLEARETLARLKEVIAQLKPVDRELVVLYLEGKKQAQIAEITGLSSSNVATKIFRIKQLCLACAEETTR